MDDRGLISKLNWFYSLETQQVDLYKKQSEMVADQYIARLLKKVSEIEQTHVEKIAGLIETLGGTPTIIGQVAGEIIGKASGVLSTATGLENLLKFNITLEKKAMADYKDAILKSGRKDVFETFWNNLLDEDLHTAWMTNKLEELTKKSLVEV